jgi:elongation factor Tu
MSRFTRPTPEQEEERRRLLALPFRMPIEDVFEIKRRGIVVIGRAEAGTLKQGDAVIIVGNGAIIESSVVAFEGFMREPDLFVAEAGDNLAILLRDVEKDQLEIGMIITKQGEA